MRLARFGCAVALAGCHLAYHPNSFETSGELFVGERATVGCLDVALSRRPNVTPTKPVVEYWFGNRCANAVTIDLGTTRAIARGTDGLARELTPFDPDGELRPLTLIGRTAGHEAIAYVRPDGAEGPAQVCVDVATIGHTVSATRWLCMDPLDGDGEIQ